MGALPDLPPVVVPAHRDVSLLLTRAQTAMEQKEWEQALVLMRAVMALDPQHEPKGK